MWNDKELQTQIEKELAWEPSLHSNQIGVTVKEGAVQLAGLVEAYWQKCAAERAVWRVTQVKRVMNELRVEPAFSTSRGDDDIALAAMTTLEWNGLVPATVDVQVADGWVTLAGTVEWQFQKEEAERALQTLHGIRGIRNGVRIQTPARASDLKAQVEEALKRSALVNTSHVKVHVTQGVVSLHGVAHSRAERDEALRAAWAAPGVSAVEDHISIGSLRGGA